MEVIDFLKQIRSLSDAAIKAEEKRLKESQMPLKRVVSELKAYVSEVEKEILPSPKRVFVKWTPAMDVAVTGNIDIEAVAKQLNIPVSSVYQRRSNLKKKQQ